MIGMVGVRVLRGVAMIGVVSVTVLRDLAMIGMVMSLVAVVGVTVLLHTAVIGMVSVTVLLHVTVIGMVCVRVLWMVVARVGMDMGHCELPLGRVVGARSPELALTSTTPTAVMQATARRLASRTDAVKVEKMA